MFRHELSFALLSPAGVQLVPRIGFVASAQYVKVLGDVGVLTMRVAGTGLNGATAEAAGATTLSGASRISIGAANLHEYRIRADIGIIGVGYYATLTDGVFIIKDSVQRRDQNGAAYLEVTAYDYNIFLRNRVVAYRGNTAETSKTGRADNVMKAVVRENLGVDATTDYDGNAVTGREIADLIVDSDISSSKVTPPTVYLEGLEGQNVLDVLQEVQAASVVAGEETLFNMIPVNGTYAPRFRTAVGLWGSDRRNKTVFSESRRNILDPAISYNYSRNKTVAYVSESGDPETQAIGDFSAGTKVKASSTRAEIWKSAGRVDPEDEDTAEVLQVVGYNELARRRPFLDISGTVLSTEQTPYRFTTRFGDGWDLGDRVTVSLNATSSETRFEPVVRAVQVNLDESGEVSVMARVGSTELL